MALPVSIYPRSSKGNFMRGKAITVITAACAILLTASAMAQVTKVPGLSIKIGDEVSAVKAALHTNIEPEPLENSLPVGFGINPNAGKTILHLRSKGISVFFKKEIVESVKFDAPFADSIAGIKLGDSEKALRSVFGKPLKTPTVFGTNQSFLYVLDDAAYIRFDLNETDGVQTIYIQK